ncbi:MAG: hypothetical protein GF403_08830 [Candidatus Coatesbacteria bacterium]|nr:hypothetical protein [Candidatus Coatesbacteria bacterium]
MRRVFTLSFSIALLAAGLLAACDLQPYGETSGLDLEWAREIADERVAADYGDGWYLVSFDAEYLDYDAHLYTPHDFSYWGFSYYNGAECELWVWVLRDGDVIVWEILPHDTDALPDAYDSADVRAWLTTARQCYRRLSGREDDVCYTLYVWFISYSSYDYTSASIDFYDAGLERLARCSLNADTGEVYDFRLD